MPWGAAARWAGWALAGVFTGLGALHVRWALKPRSGAQDAEARAGAAVPTRPDGTPLFVPRRAGTLAVAAACFCAAGLGLGAALGYGPAWGVRWGHLGLATAFALRAVGEFRYVGLFKRVRGTRFARWDTWLFSPLCLLIAALSLLIARAIP